VNHTQLSQELLHRRYRGTEGVSPHRVGVVGKTEPNAGVRTLLIGKRLWPSWLSTTLNLQSQTEQGRVSGIQSALSSQTQNLDQAQWDLTNLARERRSAEVPVFS
jgi:hypothetical protein